MSPCPGCLDHLEPPDGTCSKSNKTYVQLARSRERRATEVKLGLSGVAGGIFRERMLELGCRRIPYTHHPWLQAPALLVWCEFGCTNLRNGSHDGAHDQVPRASHRSWPSWPARRRHAPVESWHQCVGCSLRRSPAPSLWLGRGRLGRRNLLSGTMGQSGSGDLSLIILIARTHTHGTWHGLYQ